MKHVTSPTVVAKPFGGFWMKSAYRISGRQISHCDPVCAARNGHQRADYREGGKLFDHESRRRVSGEIAGPLSRSKEWLGMVDTGEAVQISMDGGRTWSFAKLGADLGKYAFRPWTHQFLAGKHMVMCAQSNRLDANDRTQSEPGWVPS
jgi:hypothetical protein